MSGTDSLVAAGLGQGLLVGALVGASFAVLLLAKSVRDFTAPGPRMADEVLSHYRLYLVYALARLAFYAFVIASFLACYGVVVYVGLTVVTDARFSPVLAGFAAATAIGALTLRAILRTLLLSPGVIVASSLYSIRHFYPAWERLTAGRMRALDIALFGASGIWPAIAAITLAREGDTAGACIIAAAAAAYLAALVLSLHWSEPRPATRSRHASRAPNFLLIGSDTLRADRLGGTGYPRNLTPTLDALARRGSRFTDCYVPCARTAPSIASMLTGTWPGTHGIRDNFITQEQTRLPVEALPDILARAGYRTAAVGDWAASDLGKLQLHFDHRDLPEDQWNMKYFLRQGPKDLRLFLSLFVGNRFGKRFLPEIYYLGGVPLTEEVGRDTRRMIARLARDDAPFFLVSFMATTHPPFASRHPYYTAFAEKGYRGESKFAMAKLRDPFEIIRRQGEPKTEFDLEQIVALYDGCVKNFDDETGRILNYLEQSGLADNTIVMVFSDHGFEFFEHDTWGQGNSAIGDFSARVPLIIADPRNPAQQEVTEVVRTVDIAPTLLELAGLEIPAQIEGASLVPLMKGASTAEELPAFYETGVWFTDLPGTPEGHLRYPHLPELLEVPDKSLGTIALKPAYHDLVVLAKDRMVRLGDWKLTYQPLTDGTLYRLFNIREDPECRNDRIADNADVAERLKSLLLRWMETDAGIINAETEIE